jgi:hypothetical protein
MRKGIVFHRGTGRFHGIHCFPSFPPPVEKKRQGECHADCSFQKFIDIAHGLQTQHAIDDRIGLRGGKRSLGKTLEFRDQLLTRAGHFRGWAPVKSGSPATLIFFISYILFIIDRQINF